MSERIKKLNDLLRDEVGRILTSELEKVDSVLVTVTGADISPTLEHANIRISVFPRDETSRILKEIKKQIYHIQQLLNKRLSMRPVPKIRFEMDTAEERAARVEKLIEKVKEK